MARVAIDRVPQLARPDRVGAAVSEADALRVRVREASELAAAAQAALDEAEREDVERAARAARTVAGIGLCRRCSPGRARRQAVG